MATLEVLTIGHSNHTIERFIELLCQHRVTAVADVRSAPYSQIHTQFNREPLAAALKQDGIGYSFLAGCGKSKLEAWQLKHFIVELFYARPRSSAVGDLQLLVA